jgi:hypothetical protein
LLLRDFSFALFNQTLKIKDHIISTSTISTATLDVSELKAGTLNGNPPLYSTSVALVANSSNWRKIAKDLIGDEPVTYDEKSKKDSLRKFPIVNIFSTDKDALARVLTKAAEVE